jgi:colanic acid biosynthesis glycosyl transferase WcaI
VSTTSRVTILGLNYAPEPTGNAPYTTGLAEHLARSGNDVTALVGFPHYPQWTRYAGYAGWRSTTHRAGVRVVRLKHWIPNPPRGVRRLASELSFGVRLAFTRWHRPDAVVLVSPALFSTWLAMVRLVCQRKIRRIVWVQDLYSQGIAETGEGGGFALTIARKVEGWTLRHAHRVVAIHETMASRMTASLGVDPQRVTVVPNWSHVIPTSLAPSEAKESLNWPPVFTALHAGNMGAKQGLDVIVEAARIAEAIESRVHFVLLGDGGERSRLESLAKGISTITFVDPIDEAQFPTALAAADVLIVSEAPGVSEMASPSKLTSYFAANRPVVAAVSEGGIVASIMADSHAGPVAPSGDAKALLAAVDGLAHDPSARSEASSAAMAYLERRLGAQDALAAWDRVLETTILGGAIGGEAP